MIEEDYDYPSDEEAAHMLAHMFSSF